ncbi:alcohol dehydrogenase [Staphylococcus saprophyticus]|uniref:Alcohol dehydrogenase n=1 Tax=Staphylococcus saprophyticus TaxID=29385 RepID=A0A380HNC5_STASA|nr:alcohol dehydrogenase [Staphylococcus saprophyticus]SUM78280.1 alcohol dehydrogenase [Staphylococcus saprophyticus]SUM83668.1 alcohol dehydrogenase [Staphylococcus saprophyticus]VDZ24396.1 alcohol dehydrogenase [Staphylococcus saprophyticus]
MKDEQVLFLSDVVPTAYWSVEHADVKFGDTVIVLGCGPIGLMAQKFAKLQGAERVIAIESLLSNRHCYRKILNFFYFWFG